jgi:ELWxxDGT repeat protein
MKALYFILFFIVSNILFAQYPDLVKDINTKGNFAPNNLTEFAGSVYFTHDDELYGDEVWKTDGTETGTILLKDINLGLESSKAQYLTKSGYVLFFVAFQTQIGWALWKTNGTEIGTVLVKDFGTGNGEYDNIPYNLTDVNGVLYFTVVTTGYGSELWKSDGTFSGTVMVKDIKSGPNGSDPTNFLNVNGTLFFSADDGISGRELWISSGTEASTVLHRDINPGSGSSNPNYLKSTVQNIGGTFTYNLFFSANTASSGTELFRLPLTCSVCTLFMYDINPGVNSSNPKNIEVFGGLILYFSADDGTNGSEVWRLLPTFAFANLSRLTDINPNAGNSDPGNFFAYGGEIYFNATTPSTGTELFKLNGTTLTTYDLVPGIEPSYATNFKIINNKLFFSLVNGVQSKCELWQIPSFGGSPQLFQEILGSKNFDNFYYLGFYPQFFVLANSQLFYVKVNNTNGPEIWKTDGVNSNLIKDVSPGSSNPRLFWHNSSYSFFVANDLDHGNELWKTDGTTGNTTLVKDIYPGGRDSEISYGEILNNKLIFNANDGQNGRELWVSDGTNTGTQMLLDLQPGNDSFGNPNEGTPYGFTKLGSNTLFFSLTSSFGYSGVTLWKTDGTAAGTIQIATIPNYTYGSAILNGEIFFIVGNNSNTELWKTNGTTAQNVTTIAYNQYVVSDLVSSGNKLYFSIPSPANGKELWVSDGTLGGTTLIRDINPGINSSNPQDITPINGLVYFSADNGSNGRELWKSDGTAIGTQMVSNINPEVTVLGQTLIQSSNPQNITAVGNTVYFSALYNNLSNPSYPYYGRELWKSNGTGLGTELVKDINNSQQTENGIHPYLFGSFAHLGNTIFFPAYDENMAAELWRSDGTAQGTFRIVDNASQKGYGLNPRNNVFANPLTNRIFFEGNNGTTGLELWSFEVCPIDLSINSIINANLQIQQASNHLTANTNLNDTPNYLGSRNIKYSAGHSITFEPGFEVRALEPLILFIPGEITTVFKAEIKACEF